MANRHYERLSALTAELSVKIGTNAVSVGKNSPNTGRLYWTKDLKEHWPCGSALRISPAKGDFGYRPIQELAL